MASKPYPFEVCKKCCPTGGSGGDITIDTEMSDTSENAVQNKVIKKYVDDNKGTQPPLIIDGWYIEKNLSNGKYSISNTHRYDAIVEAYNSGRQVMIAAQTVHVDANSNPIDIGTVFLQCITPYCFQGISTLNEFFMIEYVPTYNLWTLNVEELASKVYVNMAIGDIETALENIIAKYNLGGDVI